MSLQLPALVLCAAVLLAACGSGDSGSGDPEPGQAASPSAAYFTLDDTTAINKAAAPAQAAGTQAVARPRMAACNKFTSYPAWRACWHALLDPFSTRLTKLAATFKVLAAKDFPDKCVTELQGAAETFSGFAGKVDGLLTGIDSDKAPARNRAARQYGTTVDAVSAGFAKPFQDLTQVCYSPKDLASINASPSPKP